MNRGRVSPVILVLALVVILVVAFVVYSRRPSTSPVQVSPMAGGEQGRAQGRMQGGAPGLPGQPGTSQTASTQRNLAELGITGKPSQGDNPGLMITGFVSTPERSPLGVIGVKAGDIVISCNGEQRQMGMRLGAAIEGLQKRGEKITLVVVRDGKQVQLERAEKLPEAVSKTAK